MDDFLNSISFECIKNSIKFAKQTRALFLTKKLAFVRFFAYLN